MRNNIFILYGSLDRIQKIIESFPEIKKYIKCIVDDSVECNYFWNDIFVSTLELLENSFHNNKFVVFNEEVFLDVKNKLVEKYGIDSKKIIIARKWLLNLLKKDKEILHIPNRIRIDVCTICQLNCADCYMRKNNYGKVGKGYLKYDLFKQLLDDNDFLEEIEISNSGEIFFNPDLKLILEYSNSKGVKITINNGTNLNFITDSVAETIVRTKVEELTISIDGSSQEVYSIYRRNGNFKKVINNIKLLNKYKQKYKSEFPKLRWQYILMNHNECDIENAKELASKLNMDIFFKVDWSGMYKPKDIEKIYELTGIDFNNKNCVQSKYCDDICSQMLFHPQINWDGRLLGCCVVFQSDWGQNIFEKGLINALNSKNYRKAIYKLLGDEENYEGNNPCTTCYTYSNNILKHKYINL